MIKEYLFCATSIFALIYLNTAYAQFPNATIDTVIPMPVTQAVEDGRRQLELSGNSQNLAAGYGHWNDVVLRGMYKSSSHLLQSEISINRRFEKKGVFIGIGDTYIFNDDWFGSLSFGAGDGAFYLPKYRVDASLSKKWLEKRNLVTSLGTGLYKAPDGHVDRNISTGAAYYFDMPLILEGGIRFNNSSPGSIKTQQQFLALTYGKDKQDYITVRHGWGAEGYLSIAANSQLVNFKNRETSISWRHWLDLKTGIIVGANDYANPLYKRVGVNIGIFRDF